MPESPSVDLAAAIALLHLVGFAALVMIIAPQHYRVGAQVFGSALESPPTRSGCGRRTRHHPRRHRRKIRGDHRAGPSCQRYRSGASDGSAPALRLTPAVLDDGWRALRHRAPRYINSVGGPGTIAVLATSDAEPALERMGAASGLRRGDFPETVAARILLHIGLYSPIRHAANITCPALIQVATKDDIAPVGPARKAAARTHAATFRSYDCEHLGLYTDPHFKTVVAHQLAFLASAVPVRR